MNGINHISTGAGFRNHPQYVTNDQRGSRFKMSFQELEKFPWLQVLNPSTATILAVRRLDGNP